jgi:hypothetical protein
MFKFKTERLCLLPVAVAVVALGPALRAESEENYTKSDFAFVNVADTTTQRFTFFGATPTINNAGDVAFNALGPGFLSGAVFKAHDHTITTIASSADGVLRLFGDSLGITPGGEVAFFATVANSSDAIIAIGKGGKLNIIADANQLGLFARLMTFGGVNNSGTVAFQAFRQGFTSQAIFAGNGGPVATIADTKDGVFAGVGNSDINASGKVVFEGFLADGTEGLFAGKNGSVVVTGAQFPNFGAFLDPVINDGGTVASAALLQGGGGLAFTAKEGRVTRRNNPANPLFTIVDEVCINNAGHIAFFGDTPTSERTIYIETTGRDFPVPVISSGDALFGSIVTGLSLGTHSLNEHDEIAFQYALADGRSGIAIARPYHHRD